MQDTTPPWKHRMRIRPVIGWQSLARFGHIIQRELDQITQSLLRGETIERFDGAFDAASYADLVDHTIPERCSSLSRSRRIRCARAMVDLRREIWQDMI